MKSGDTKTKQFYDSKGWKRNNGELLDTKLFGWEEDGPIRKKLYNIRRQRVIEHLSKAENKKKILECGCGGNPALDLCQLFSSYYGIDFSKQGIEESKAILSNVDVETYLQVADVCNLPFNNQDFDAVYSAHMIYHISDPSSQETALQEMLRVLKPGGSLILITANPRPLMFPVRLLKRLIADSAILGTIANRLRKKAVLPYKPMKLSWYKAQLKAHGQLKILCYGLPSHEIYQTVSESGFFGKRFWSLLGFIDINFPRVAAYLGNYVVICFTKAK